MIIRESDPGYDHSLRIPVSLAALPRGYTGLPDGTTRCPVCGKTRGIAVSRYVDADYFCSWCRAWFLRSDAEGPYDGDALERLT